MPLPTVPIYFPANRAAREAFERLMATEPATAKGHVVRNVCLVAVSSVGRAKWAQESRKLRTAREGALDFQDGVNCWCWVLKWAIVAGAFTAAQAKRIVKRLDEVPKDPTQHQKVMENMIHGEVRRKPWQEGADVPVGAMVYHGRKSPSSTNPISHVTLHIGNRRIVGVWAASFESLEAKTQFIALLDRNMPATPSTGATGPLLNQPGQAWVTDALITDITAFGLNIPGDIGTSLEYSDGPFWELMQLG